MKVNLITLAVVILQIRGDYNKALHRIPEDGRLNFTALSWKYGHPAEEYDLTTHDGYIIKLNHIVGEQGRPVLLIHGALLTADSFILRGDTSLAITLAREGYDVWALNIRGNRYSRSHVHLNADKHKEYWDFSLDEIAYYDVPLAIDFILMKTNLVELPIIGFSEGTTLAYIMGAMRPEYNDKVSIIVSLAPIYFLRNTRPFMSALVNYSKQLYTALVKAGFVEFTGYYSLIKRLWDDICTIKDIGYKICLMDFLNSFAGADVDEIEKDFFLTIVGHFPAGASTKSLYHLVNFGIRKNIGQFYYGPLKNEIVYGSRTPPSYDLSRVTTKVALFVGQNDRISTLEDAVLLKDALPNVVKYHVIERPQFNHMDFVWGRNTYKTLFPHVLDTLERYG